MRFIADAIAEHTGSKAYAEAVTAEKYFQKENETITKYQKLLYTISGKAVPDNYSANHKCASGFYEVFVTQEVLFLLGNGATFADKNIKQRIGGNRFDRNLVFAAMFARMHGVSFGYYREGRAFECFKLTEFVPLYDEETGALMAGIRFWQLAEDKPQRITLYEADGFTEYIKRDGVMQTIAEKRGYKITRKTSKVDGTEIIDGGSYPAFPIIPFWGSVSHRSSIIGLREQIDCFDLIKSGFANDLDDASMIYWTLENAGGMDDVDLVKFVERMHTVRAAVLDEDGAKATAHTMEVPYESREVYLDRLTKDLYRDAMALDVEKMQSGNVTATQIRAAYEPLNEKSDLFEYSVLDFVSALLELAGIEELPKFKRSMIVNQLEETQMILLAASYLDDDTVVEKLPFMTPEEIEEVKTRRDIEGMHRTTMTDPSQLEE